MGQGRHLPGQPHRLTDKWLDDGEAGVWGQEDPWVAIQGPDHILKQTANIGSVSIVNLALIVVVTAAADDNAAAAVAEYNDDSDTQHFKKYKTGGIQEAGVAADVVLHSLLQSVRPLVSIA